MQNKIVHVQSDLNFDLVYMYQEFPLLVHVLILAFIQGRFHLREPSAMN